MLESSMVSCSNSQHVSLELDQLFNELEEIRDQQIPLRNPSPPRLEEGSTQARPPLRVSCVRSSLTRIRYLAYALLRMPLHVFASLTRNIPSCLKLVVLLPAAILLLSFLIQGIRSTVPKRFSRAQRRNRRVGLIRRL